MLKKIALLAHENTTRDPGLTHIQSLLTSHAIESQVFYNSDTIESYNPDCVLSLSPQHPKLTKYPTYGLLDKEASDYLELPRFARNLLTYDGYLTLSPSLTQMIEDITFGARKLDSKVAIFGFSPPLSFYPAPSLSISTNDGLAYYEPNFRSSKHRNLITLLSKKIKNFTLVSGVWTAYSGIKIADCRQISEYYNTAGVGLALDESTDNISPRLLEIIASGAVAITYHNPRVEELFGTNVLYLSADLSNFQTYETINQHLKWIKNNPEQAALMKNNAFQIYQASFTFEKLLNNLNELHASSLIAKGYCPDPKESANKLPSVSYIIRTGGDNRKLLEITLDSLVSQNYPHLQVIFVIHKKFDYLEELITQYSCLKIKAIYSLKSLRSTAIRDGMAAVDTELFGLLDDDDTLFPNHVRSLVKTLQYHQNKDLRGHIRLAYSGSVMTDENKVFEYEEEFFDAKLQNLGNKRSVEHFRVYHPLKMANHCWYMMSNSWLAHSSLIDEETLTDPRIHTCEDLYLELLFAQKTYFAFSVEMTTTHRLHTGSSTFVDSSSHLSDSQRIALRNFSRLFPGAYEYDSRFSQLGMDAYENKSLLPPEKEPMYFYTQQYLSNYVKKTKLARSQQEDHPESLSRIQKIKRLLRILKYRYPTFYGRLKTNIAIYGYKVAAKKAIRAVFTKIRAQLR